MRYLAGLFDAPAPAAAGLAALASAGISPRDVRVLSTHAPDFDAGEPAVSAFLEDRGVPPNAAAALSRAVALGATLLLARVPSARAAAGSAALRSVGALDPNAFES